MTVGAIHSRVLGRHLSHPVPLLLFEPEALRVDIWSGSVVCGFAFALPELALNAPGILN